MHSHFDRTSVPGGFFSLKSDWLVREPRDEIGSTGPSGGWWGWGGMKDKEASELLVDEPTALLPSASFDFIDGIHSSRGLSLPR